MMKKNLYYYRLSIVNVCDSSFVLYLGRMSNETLLENFFWLRSTSSMYCNVKDKSNGLFKNVVGENIQIISLSKSSILVTTLRMQ